MCLIVFVVSLCSLIMFILSKIIPARISQYKGSSQNGEFSLVPSRTRWTKHVWCCNEPEFKVWPLAIAIRFLDQYSSRSELFRCWSSFYLFSLGKNGSKIKYLLRIRNNIIVTPLFHHLPLFIYLFIILKFLYLTKHDGFLSSQFSAVVS